MLKEMVKGTKLQIRVKETDIARLTKKIKRLEHMNELRHEMITTGAEHNERIQKLQDKLRTDQRGVGGGHSKERVVEEDHGSANKQNLSHIRKSIKSIRKKKKYHDKSVSRFNETLDNGNPYEDMSMLAGP